MDGIHVPSRYRIAYYQLENLVVDVPIHAEDRRTEDRGRDEEKRTDLYCYRDILRDRFALVVGYGDGY